ncbi:MAG: hypothetical protein IGS23_14060 [Rivularia sp. T60_A2020_040]|nr:hypothetical protein [Rivularia sp. T60_A2020_040]
MANITNGTGSTLKSTKLAPRLLEAFFYLEAQEQEKLVNRTTITTNFNTNTANVSFSFEVQPLITNEGAIMHTAVNYLGDIPFIAGEGSEIKGEHLIQNIFEMINLFKILSSDPVINPSNINALTATYNYTNNTLSGTLQFQLEVVRQSDGTVKVAAKEQLL